MARACHLLIGSSQFARVSVPKSLVPKSRGLSALMVFSSVAARFFDPQIGGASANPSAPSGVFRIDHATEERVASRNPLQLPRNFAVGVSNPTGWRKILGAGSDGSSSFIYQVQIDFSCPASPQTTHTWNRSMEPSVPNVWTCTWFMTLSEA